MIVQSILTALAISIAIPNVSMSDAKIDTGAPRVSAVAGPLLTAPSVSTVADSKSFPKIRFPRIPFPRFRWTSRSSSKDVNAPINLIEQRMRLLVSQEESWYSDHGSYGKDVAALPPAKQSDTATAGDTLDLVQIQVLYANKRSWTAIASHPAAPGKTCVIFVGDRESLPIVPRTRADANEARTEAIPACDKSK